MDVGNSVVVNPVLLDHLAFYTICLLSVFLSALDCGVLWRRCTEHVEFLCAEVQQSQFFSNSRDLKLTALEALRFMLEGVATILAKGDAGRGISAPPRPKAVYLAGTAQTLQTPIKSEFDYDRPLTSHAVSGARTRPGKNTQGLWSSGASVSGSEMSIFSPSLGDLAGGKGGGDIYGGKDSVSNRLLRLLLFLFPVEAGGE